MTGGGGQGVKKASRGEAKDFLKPTKCDFDIFSFFFYDLPMNLVAFVKEFQNRICFIAQGTYPLIMKLFEIDTFIANIVSSNRQLKFCQL